jgi:hypothetical protein
MESLKEILKNMESFTFINKEIHLTIFKDEIEIKNLNDEHFINYKFSDFVKIRSDLYKNKGLSILISEDKIDKNLTIISKNEKGEELFYLGLHLSNIN